MKAADTTIRAPASGGGFRAIWYTLRKARAAGGLLRMWSALRSRNACKTCALGMGGQQGGMVNEAGRFPEVCKKSVQAMAADMAGALREGFFEEFGFDALSRFSSRELEASGRLTKPLYAGPGDRSYRAIAWDEALDRAGAALRGALPNETFFYASGRSGNEAGFLLQLFARLYGTNNVNNCSFFCHQASGVGLKQTIGSGTGTVSLEDVDHCDLVFLIGANPASNHPRLMRDLMQLKRRGGRVVVINPLREVGLVNFSVPSDVRSLLFGSPIADEYVQPHIGGDIAVLSGIAKAVLERGGSGGADTDFIDTATDGFAAWRASIEAMDWGAIVASGGVSEADLRRVADVYRASKRTILCWTMGITHHLHGVSNVHAISNLALLRGMIARPGGGAGLLPLRGHSNVQGMGTVGVSPVPTPAFLAGLERRFGVRLPKEPGMDTLSCVRRAAEGGVKVAMHLGGNLFGSCPDSAAAERALGSIGMTLFLSTTLNTGHIHGRGKECLILPVRARDEEEQATTQESMFSYVRLSEGVGKRGGGRPPRYVGPRGDVQVIAALAERVLGERLPPLLSLTQMSDHLAVRAHIAAVIPELEQLGTIDQRAANGRGGGGGSAGRAKDGGAKGGGGEFVIPGRTIRTPHFKTDTGRAKFVMAPLPAAPPALSRAEGGPLRLATIRSEGQFNTVVYEEEDVYRGQERRDVILMNEGDMAALGLRENDRVSVSSVCGEMPGIVVRPYAIRAGNAAMYCPEANVLVPAKEDPLSKTPAFKNVSVRVKRQVSLV